MLSNGHLKINDAQINDSGIYMCSAESGGCHVSQSGKLQMIEAVEINDGKYQNASAVWRQLHHIVLYLRTDKLSDECKLSK